jgi:hypothetical protein
VINNLPRQANEKHRSVEDVVIRIGEALLMLDDTKIGLLIVGYKPS